MGIDESLVVVAVVLASVFVSSLPPVVVVVVPTCYWVGEASVQGGIGN